jgi:PiT family inorganic phosphate transporter
MPSSLLLWLLLLTALAVAFANGANANFKGVASLHGSGTCSYAVAARWSTWTTAAGCLAGLGMTGSLMQTFSGKGLVPDSVAGEPGFLLAAAGGAGMANLLATRLGFPVSTTHLLMGGLLGAGLAWDASSVSAQGLWAQFVKPLLMTPVLAVVVGALVYGLLSRLRLAPDHRTPLLDGLHFASSGAVCFARGMNDTPKIAALLGGVGGWSGGVNFALVTGFMALGGWLGARKVAETLSHKITDMNPGQGFAANVTTAALVVTGSLQGLPLSTTHVTVGSLLGIGSVTRQARWRTAIPVLLAWVVTLPCAAVLAALVWWLTPFLRGGAGSPLPS